MQFESNHITIWNVTQILFTGFLDCETGVKEEEKMKKSIWRPMVPPPATMGKKCSLAGLIKDNAQIETEDTTRSKEEARTGHVTNRFIESSHLSDSIQLGSTRNKQTDE